ncbi:hypothetical protein [Nitrospirillum viridazoti]|uniref:Uncharacterized protein n=1 Tax=Nitrospirillum amazonense TaxID=28077 RepID=A0A560II27_9PROT|nr:hypothetical protein [Nitrospirillum amazonense]TWB58702.1 hypothetical protein FBZ92_109195 [Nitrospirillum amazonense]
MTDLTKLTWVHCTGVPGVILAETDGQPDVLTIDVNSNLDDATVSAIADHVIKLQAAFVRLGPELQSAVARLAELDKAVRDCLPLIEEAEKQGLVGDESAMWPVEILRGLVRPQQPKGTAWPGGATVKLEWDCGSGADRTTGWAKRDPDGNVVSVVGGSLLDLRGWRVIEELQSPAREN